MIEDLTKYMINEDKPEGEGKSGWYAGGQLEALRFYFDKKVRMIAEYTEDDYQGECAAVMYVDGKYFLWRGDFGSCSGCDALEGSDGYKYIEKTMTSVKEFDSIKELLKYLEFQKKDYLYDDDACRALIKGIDESLFGVDAK